MPNFFPGISLGNDWQRRISLFSHCLNMSTVLLKVCVRPCWNNMHERQYFWSSDANFAHRLLRLLDMLIVRIIPKPVLQVPTRILESHKGFEYGLYRWGNLYFCYRRNVWWNHRQPPWFLLPSPRLATHVKLKAGETEPSKVVAETWWNNKTGYGFDGFFLRVFK